MHALEHQLRAQAKHLQACAQRAAGDPRLKSAWIEAVVRLMDASAATGSAIADLKWSPRDPVIPVRLRLPDLPALPNAEGGPPPPQIRKTTSGHFRNRLNGLAPQRPRVKSKGGAQRGNRNAQTSGCHTSAFR